jgi:hypothetical protein
MPLPLPNLDDRTFTDLAVELRSLIPQYDRTWTNHNPADPGITLIELFAWLAEMVHYRLNRIQDRSYFTFLELIGVRPSSPQAPVTFAIKVPQAALPVSFVIPRGTRVAARDAQSGAEIIFETLVDCLYSADNWDPERKLLLFTAPAINTMVIENEGLGVSNGSPRQEFFIRRGPFFLDREQESYSGNPQVFVNGVQWAYKADLLSSQTSDQHFTAEELAGLIRFGDGARGKIPAAGAQIICSYRRVGGAQGNVAAEKITTLKDPLAGVDPAVVAVSNAYAATGGVDGQTLEDLLALGLSTLQGRYRAVSDEDFEYLAGQVEPGKVARVKVVADRNLEGTAPIAEGHVSLIVLPAGAYLGLAAAPIDHDAATGAVMLNRTGATMAAALAGADARRLNKKILGYLDERRLITTIVHVVEPAFTVLRLVITLAARPGVNVSTLKKQAEQTIAAFLDPYQGWEGQTGWPFGRPVYRSELFQQIEAIVGVDYVTGLSMNGSTTTSGIAVGENQLVALDELSVTVA